MSRHHARGRSWSRAVVFDAVREVVCVGGPVALAILDEIGWQTLSSNGAHDFHVAEHSISFSVGSGGTKRKLTIRFDDDLDRFDARLSHRRLRLWRPAVEAEGLCFDDVAHWVAVAVERTGDRCVGAS